MLTHGAVTQQCGSLQPSNTLAALHSEYDVGGVVVICNLSGVACI